MILVIALVVAAIITVLVFNPPKRVIGGLRGGPIAPNDYAYREEYKCLGLKRDFCPPWPDYGCDLLCYGIVYDQQCYIETYIGGGGLRKVSSQCR